jgi:predicted lipoprotein with Yx(FWY)xxD motif
MPEVEPEMTSERTRTALLAALVIGLVVAACGTSSGAQAPTGGPTGTPDAVASGSSGAGTYEVALANDAVLGAYLVGEDGRALYLFTKDSNGTSVCTGDCAAAWPPFVLEGSETVAAGAGVSGTLGAITRADGSKQVAINGVPLYYFAGDKKAGDVNGQGLNGVWFLVDATGAAAGSGGKGTY